MAGETKELTVAEGVAVTGPTQSALALTSFLNYASDAAYVSAKGSAAGSGDAYYNTTTKRARLYANGAWTNIVNAGVTNSRGTPGDITVTGITPSGWVKEVMFVQGSGGAIDISTNPQIVSTGNQVGDELTLIGRSDTNTLTLEHGNGLDLNGVCILRAGSIIKLILDGTNWLEASRNDI